MVNYGKTITQAQRSGWEHAYLRYNDLKQIVREIEINLERQDSRWSPSVVDHPYQLNSENDVEENNRGASAQMVATTTGDRALNELKRNFFSMLQQEVEKMALFTLTKQGQLAESIGSMRFLDTGLFHNNSNIFQSVHYSNDIQFYAVLGVEMIHLLRFLIINSIGIQKILKKYNKIFETMDEPHHYYVGSDHLLQLTQSQSIMAIQSSLQTALGECYMMGNIGEPDDALALVRFQCIMECSYTLRKYSGLLQGPFMEFLSKQSMIVTATNFGGMDRASKRALHWLLHLQPEDILSMDQIQLEHMWSRWMGGPEVKLSPKDGIPRLPQRLLGTIREEEMEELLADEKLSDRIKTSPLVWGGVNASSMFLNLMSILLYTVNYYIVAPTANHYAIKLGTDGAFGATLIGASSFSALFSAFAYSYWYTTSTFKSALTFSALCPFVGNLLYALALSYKSITLTIFGRILCGFGSAEVLNRQLISACVDFEGMSKASALFVAFGASGMSIGPLIAGVLDMVSGRDMKVDIRLPFMPAGGIIYNHVTAPGFVMATLWLLQLAALIIFFREPIRINTSAVQDDDEVDTEENSEEPEEAGLAVPADSTGSYGSINSSEGSPINVVQETGKGLWHEVKTTWNLVFATAGLPITLLLFCYIELADEVIISSCSMVLRRYFGWPGALAGFFIASLGSLVIPAHFVVEKASRHISERKTLFRSVVAIVICLIAIFNYSGLYYDIVGVMETKSAQSYSDIVENTTIQGQKLKAALTPGGEFFYDWGYGEGVYITFLSLLFMATIVLEGVDTSIMAKVTPPKLNDMFCNCGLLATLIGTLGRVFADSIITVSALLDINIFVDFVNATFFPLLLLAIGFVFLVRRYYTSLV